MPPRLRKYGETRRIRAPGHIARREHRVLGPCAAPSTGSATRGARSEAAICSQVGHCLVQARRPRFAIEAGIEGPARKREAHAA